MDPKQFAESTLQLLQADPSKYVNFGMYWYLVKGVLRKFYTTDNLYLLGDYVDRDVVSKMPDMPSLSDALVAAAEEYQQNAMFNLGSNVVQDADGQSFTLIDPDAGQ